MEVVREQGTEIGVASACRALDVPRASFYRALSPGKAGVPTTQRPVSPRALAPEERREVLGMLNSERFVDDPPHEVYATLLDEGKYLCSVRTMYRILESEGESWERRNQARHPVYVKPELSATQPNELWSWDITKLLVRPNGLTSTCTSSWTCSAATWWAGWRPTEKRRPWPHA